MSQIEVFPSTEDWQELDNEWDSDSTIPIGDTKSDDSAELGTSIEPDWDAWVVS